MNHTGDHSPSQVSNRLRSVGHVASGSRPRPCIVDPELPLEPSFRGVLPRFRGNEGRSVPLPTDAECSQFGTVSDRAYRQAVTRLSWLSYSPSGFSPERRPCHGPVSAVAGRELPTPARLNGPFETSTRLCRRAAMVRTPWEGFAPSWTTAASTRVEVSPCRPSFAETKTVSDRTSGLLWPRLLPYEGSMSGQDYADEPPSNRTSHSHGIRLYGQAR